MPRYLCYHQGYFFEWSTVVDAPVTMGMGLSAFKEHCRRHSPGAMSEFPRRIKRTIEKGTSYAGRGQMTLETLVGGWNRAGFNETFLTLDEIIRIYCVEQRDPIQGEGIKIEYNDEGNQITVT